MCGARAIGWYFSRARVHETGPYGDGHYVWQHESSRLRKSLDDEARTARLFPDHWPVMETVHLMRDEQIDAQLNPWELWASHRDEWGAFYTRDDQPEEAVFQRKNTWEGLSQLTSRHVQMEVPR
jgi:hypothetical protein